MNKAPPKNTRDDQQLIHGSDDFVPLTKQWVEHSIADQFSRQAFRTPDHVAIKTTNGITTYEDLDRHSNCVANAILGKSASGQQAIGFLLDHDAIVPAALLGILKSGNFYFALDSNYPLERNRYLLQDSDAKVLITNDQHIRQARTLADDLVDIINIDRLDQPESTHAPEVTIKPDDIAYLVYTSGSTGEPKGVVQTQRSVLHKTLRHTNGWCLSPRDRVALLFAYNFGASASNLFAALLNGASLYPFDLKRNSLAEFLRWLEAEKITLFHTVPTFFRHMTASMKAPINLPDLRLIRIAGETIYGEDIRLFQQHFDRHVVLQVGMGSSETGTILQSYYTQDSDYSEGLIAPGTPAEDMQVAILSEGDQELAGNETGEIVVRSRYLFSGYWKRPSLTATVLKPATDNSGDWIYRTRDLGCRLDDGRFMHLGRMDAQVKIRGHRIEVGEVELAILKQPGIGQATVIVKESGAGEKQLVAYFVVDCDATISAESLRETLRATLPSFMMPAEFVPVEKLPLTAGGKVDRQKLASSPLPPSERNGVAPRDHLETHLLAIWQEVLRSKGFGIRDDFFDVGGDSLLLMQVGLRVEELFGKTINMANLPNRITIENLADALFSYDENDRQRPIIAIKESGTRPPLFFLHGDYISGGAYCRNLAKHFDSAQPFYAVAPHGLDGQPIPRTIEAMAADHVAAVRTVQPSGPYRLGGFCWGGTVALEMARQLQSQGDDVQALVLIDTDPRNMNLRPVRRGIRRLGRWFALSEDVELSLFTKCRRLKNGWDLAGDGLGQKCKFLLAKVPRIPRVLTLLYPVRDPLLSTDSGGSNTVIVNDDRHSRWLTYHEIHQSYVAEPYRGNLALFRSSRLQNRYPSDPKAGWRYITPNIEIHSIDGDHWTCVTTNARDVAAKICAYLSSLPEQ